MRAPVKILVILAAGIYVALCGTTWIWAAPALERQMLGEAKQEWKQARQEEDQYLAKMMSENPKYHDYWARVTRTHASNHGPSVTVKFRGCFVPFLFFAKTSKIIGGLNGSGTAGLFLFTPWRVYPIAVSGTWVS